MNKDDQVARGQAVAYIMEEVGWDYIEEYLEKELDSLKNSLIYGEFDGIEERNAVKKNVEFIENFLSTLDKWIEKKDEIVSEKLEDNI